LLCSFVSSHIKRRLARTSSRDCLISNRDAAEDAAPIDNRAQGSSLANRRSRACIRAFDACSARMSARKTAATIEAPGRAAARARIAQITKT